MAGFESAASFRTAAVDLLAIGAAANFSTPCVNDQIPGCGGVLPALLSGSPYSALANGNSPAPASPDRTLLRFVVARSGREVCASRFLPRALPMAALHTRPTRLLVF